MQRCAPNAGLKLTAKKTRNMRCSQYKKTQQKII